MANIDPAPSWANIRRLETTDRNMAGPGGILNDPTTSIAARLNLLRDNDTTLGNSVAAANARQDAADTVIADIQGQVLNAPGTLSDLDHGAPISAVGDQFPDVLSIDNSRGPVIALNESIADLVKRDEWLKIATDLQSDNIQDLRVEVSAIDQSASEYAQQASESAAAATLAKNQLIATPYGPTFPTTSTFLAGTQYGDYGWVVLSPTVLALYRNNAGVAFDEGVRSYIGNGSESIQIPAEMLRAVSGASQVAMGFDRRVPYLQLPKSNDLFFGITLALPADWSSFAATFEVLSLASSAGNVSIGCTRYEYSSGESIDVSPTGQSAVFAMPTANNIVTYATHGIAIPCTPGKRSAFRFSRNRSSGSDTYSQPIGLLSVTLEKRS
ncbi:hypothetical protein Kintu_gp18 [Xanthomonas phage Kintu]